MILAVSLVGVLSAPTAQAATIALNFDNTSTASVLSNPPFTLGWSFTTQDDIVVTDLGLFDNLQDGLVDSYEIGLWDSGGNLLVSTTLASGTSASLDDKFRFTSVADTLLSANQTYFIGALFLTGNDGVIAPGEAVNLITASEILFGQATFASGGSLSFPGFGLGDTGIYGPNFRFEAADVPEPATLLMFGMGATWLAARRRRDSRS
jgi:hypothetical protein